MSMIFPAVFRSFSTEPRYGVHRSAILIDWETFDATFKSSVLKIDLKTLKKITMPTELMITIGTITIFTISTAPWNGRVDQLTDKRQHEQKGIGVLAVSFFLPPDEAADHSVNDRGENTGCRGDPLRKDHITVGRCDHSRNDPGYRTAEKTGR